MADLSEKKILKKKKEVMTVCIWKEFHSQASQMDQLIPATIILSGIQKLHAKKKKNIIYFCHGDIVMATEGMNGNSISSLSLHTKLVLVFENDSCRKYNKGIEVSCRREIDY